MPENEATLRIRELLEQSRQSLEDSNKQREKAQELMAEMIRARKEALLQILNEKGLAICTDPFYNHTRRNWKDENNPTAQELGVYPRENMRLQFSQPWLRNHDSHGQHSTTGGWHDSKVSFICPSCLPKENNRVNLRPYDEKRDNINDALVMSEVIEEDGKLIRVVDGADLTAMNEHRHRPVIWRNGKVPGTHPIDAEVYSLLGIPELPEFEESS